MNKRVFKFAISNIVKSRWFTVASVLVMTFTFFMLSSFISVGVISRDVLKYLETQAQITVFFKDSFLEDDILKIKSDLELDPDIQSVGYTSKQEALDSYIGEHQNDPLLLESLTRDIFPASLDIRARDIRYLPEVVKKFEGNPDVEEVVYYKDAITTFKKFSDIIKYGGIAMVTLLLLTSIITVLLTIGSSIYIRNDEIAVMRLVGGSSWFIRGPFIIQGLIYGVVAAFISQIVFTIIVSVLGGDIALLFKGIPVVNLNFVYLLIVFGTQLLFGALLGFVGSMFAVKRYLKI
ncbi:MAG: permease-like cell division protein FtsX [Patescibacteria group bacterium]